MNITHHKNGEIKTLVEEAPYHPGYEDVGFEPKVLNNEPVVWLVQYKDRHEFRWSKPEHLFEALACEPLYTHPVKEPTDEEILEIGENCDNYWDNCDLIDFARAILHKTQEADKIESLGTVNIGGVHFRNGKEVK